MLKNGFKIVMNLFRRFWTNFRRIWMMIIKIYVVDSVYIKNQKL